MTERVRAAPPTLYERDETAWTDLTARLVDERRWDEVDADNLSEYLRDMARRDRREVHSRLGVLMTHLLKWDYQQDRRSNSWQATIRLQRKELLLLLESLTLRNHAVQIFADAYAWAVDQAAAETGLPPTTFPPNCPYSIDQVLGEV
jgi:hypothetical protein